MSEADTARTDSRRGPQDEARRGEARRGKTRRGVRGCTHFVSPSVSQCLPGLAGWLARPSCDSEEERQGGGSASPHALHARVCTAHTVRHSSTRQTTRVETVMNCLHGGARERDSCPGCPDFYSNSHAAPTLPAYRSAPTTSEGSRWPSYRSWRCGGARYSLLTIDSLCPPLRVLRRSRCSRNTRAFCKSVSITTALWCRTPVSQRAAVSQPTRQSIG